MSSKLNNSQTTRVILVRHGQSTFNALGLYQGCSDESVLTEVGYQDANRTGHFLKALKVDAIYASSLKRAQQTAKEILGVIAPQVEQKQIHVTELLKETDLPDWQGLAFKYVKENFSEEYRRWKEFPHEFKMSLLCLEAIGANDIALNPKEKFIYPALDLYSRVQQFWQQILPLHIGETIVVVSHGGTNRALISTALGVTPDRYHCIQQSNCGISVLNFSNGSLASGKLELMNLASHVDEKLPKPQEGGKGLRLLLIPAGASEEQTNNFANLLQEYTIDFSISGILDVSQTMTQKILQNHPETVHLEVLREDLSEAWTAKINVKSTNNSDRLITGLVVAKANILKRLIAQAIAMNPNRIDSLEITPGTISAIQFPSSEHPPILQAMNITNVKEFPFTESTKLETTVSNTLYSPFS